MRPLPLLLTCAAALLCAACSTEQVYSVGQQFRRNECAKLPDTQDHQRCMSSTGASYEEYRREVDKASSPK